MFKHRYYLLLLLVFVACAARPMLLIDDPNGRIDHSATAAAAEPLLARGVRVAVLFRDGTASEAAQHLAGHQLLRGDQIADDTIALFVSYNPQYSELRVGSNWSAYLPDEHLEDLRTTVLNPALRSGNPTAAVTTTLTALEMELAAGIGLEDQLRRWVLGSVVVGFVLLFAGPPLLRRLRRGTIGRVTAQLWAQTAPGRRQAQRERERRNVAARTSCERIATTVRAGISRFVPCPVDIQAQLADLDTQLTACTQRPGDDPDLAQELAELRRRYEALERSCANLQNTLRSTDTSLQKAQQILEQARQSLQRTNRKQKPVGSDVFAELDLIDRQRDALVMRHTNLLSEALPLEALIAASRQIGVTSVDLTAEVKAIWRRYRPADVAVKHPPKQPSTLTWHSDAQDSGASFTNRSNDSGWSDPSDSSGQGGESRSGGDW